MRVVISTLSILVFITVSMYCVDVGSDSDVNRFDAQVELADGDRIAGFAALDAGFVFNDYGMTATFDSFFPVSGDVIMNFGTLELNQDLVLQNIASISVWGHINGNGHLLELAPSANILPLEEGAGGVCTLTFTFEDSEPNAVNSVHFSYDNEYIVSGVDTDLHVDKVVNENYLEDRATTALARTINGAQWHPSRDHIGLGIDSGAGDELFTYTFSRTADTLTLIDSVNIGGGGNNAVKEVSWHPDGGHLAIASDSNSLTVTVYVVNADGTFGASTSIGFSRNANTVDWNADGTYLAVGTDAQGGGGSDELLVYSFTPSPLTLTLNASFDSGQSTNSVSWNKAGSANGEIVVGAQTGDTLTVYRHDGGAGTLTEVSTGLTLASAVNSVDWHLNGVCIAAGLVNNNEGTAGEIRSYTFLDDTLTEISSIQTGDDTQSVDYSPNGNMLATGDDGLGGSDPALDLYEVSAFAGDFITFDDIHMILNVDTFINDPPINFTGESSFNGHGHSLSFSETFSMAILPNASVLFKNILIDNLVNGKIVLTDNTSTVSFQNVTLELHGDYTFDTGKFVLLDDLVIHGNGNTFVYESSEESTILGKASPNISENEFGFCGSLILSPGTTFQYNAASANLISLQDATAKIVMQSATLEAATAWELTNGTLQVDGGSSLVATNGITFGDGTAANNLNVKILPAATLEVTGQLTDKNV